MKLRFVFWIGLLCFLILGIILFTTIGLDIKKKNFNVQIENYLVSSVSAKEERLIDYLYELESDTMFLSNSEKSRAVFKEDIVINKDAVIFDVSEEFLVIAKEIENYLKVHPDMSLKELLENEEFKSIALQKVGVKEYSTLMGLENKEIYFHIDPLLVGANIDEVVLDFPRLAEIFNKLGNVGEASGFYSWKDEGGIIREKYGEFRKIDGETSDGEKFLFGVTTYVEDYKVANVSDSLRKYLNDFSDVGMYHNILFVSPDGRIIYMTLWEGGIGVNIEDIDGGLFDAYKSSLDLKKGEIGFYGPFFGYLGDTELHLASISNVYDKGVFLGTVIIMDDMEDINVILGGEMKGVREEEIYLVNDKSLLLTKMRFRDVDVMVQEIKTDSVEICLRDFKEAKKKNISVEEYELIEGFTISSFLDFKGDEVFGLHFPIGIVGWCLLSEVNVDEVLNIPLKEDLKKTLLAEQWLWWILIFGIIGAGFFIDKNLFLVKIKKKSLRGIFVLLFIILFFSLNFSNFISVSALSVAVHVPEKYTDVVAGERFYFEIEVKYPENPKRKDLKLNYEIIDSDGKIIAQSKVLKAVETQASFIDFIVIPESASKGLYIIRVKIADYEDLSEEVEASFQIVGSGFGQVQIYFFIILGVLILVAILVIASLFVTRRRRR